MAVATGVADVVVCYRAFNERSGRRFGTGVQDRPAGATAEQAQFALDVAVRAAHAGVVGGDVRAGATCTSTASTSEDFGRVAVADRKHAATNPKAWFYEQPITLEDHQASPLDRRAAAPARLLPGDRRRPGARRHDRRAGARPAAAAGGHRRPRRRASADDQHMMTSYYRDDIAGLPGDGRSSRGSSGRQSGLAPDDIQTAVLYDHFTPFVLHAARGVRLLRARARPRTSSPTARIELGGRLPVNTHGGQLGEAYIHGMNGIAEGVRQVRGTSVNQVDGAEHVLVTAGTGVPTSALDVGSRQVKQLVPEFTGSELEGARRGRHRRGRRPRPGRGSRPRRGRREGRRQRHRRRRERWSPRRSRRPAARRSVPPATSATGTSRPVSSARRSTTYGDLNVLVNNAGVLRDRMIFSISADEWDTVLRVHLRGHAATCQAATAYWRERNKATGEQQWARVINTASEAFLFGSPGQPNYSAAKAGIAALTLSVAHGCARYGVRANALAPRARTAMTEATFPPPPEGDEVDPWAIEHVAPVVVWLGTRAADHVTGNVFVVYSGKVGVMKAPQLDAAFTRAGETWTVDELDKTVGSFLGDGNRHGFAVGTDLKL